MANREHVEKLQEGVGAWNAWRKTNPYVRPDLTRTGLSEANLRSANLSNAHLRYANLSNAHLQNANLRDANLRDANLWHANLRDANLISANLSRANFVGADLNGALLRHANLTGADIRNADLSSAHISRSTCFEDVIVSGDTKGLGPWIFNPEKYIIREIEFPPEYRQSGIGIMNYFAEVLRQKYPDIPATVQITQEEQIVRMTIETDDGHREIVDKTLEEYGLVISGQRQPAELLTNPVAIMGLQHKLDMAEMEIRHANNQLQLSYQQNQLQQGQVHRLEARLDEFQLLMGDQLRHADRLVDLLEAHALTSLLPLLERGLTEADKDEVQRILTEAGKQNTSLIKRFAEQVTVGAIGGTIGGVNATLLTSWLPEVLNQLGIVIRLAL